MKQGTIGLRVVDISKLYARTGMFACGPSFTSTAACESAITYIDGDEGILRCEQRWCTTVGQMEG